MNVSDAAPKKAYENVLFFYDPKKHICDKTGDCVVYDIAKFNPLIVTSSQEYKKTLHYAVKISKCNPGFMLKNYQNMLLKCL